MFLTVNIFQFSRLESEDQWLLKMCLGINLADVSPNIAKGLFILSCFARTGHFYLLVGRLAWSGWHVYIDKIHENITRMKSLLDVIFFPHKVQFHMLRSRNSSRNQCWDLAKIEWKLDHINRIYTSDMISATVPSCLAWTI